jgi:Bifunctional DNA primase/polymerase, N-terminal
VNGWPPLCGCMWFAPDDPVANRIGLGAAALRYNQAGLRTLSLARCGKNPHKMLGDHRTLGDRGGVYQATADQRVNAERHAADPAANVGVATGSVSQLAVIDGDRKHYGIDGPSNFARFLLSNGLPFPDAPWVRTPTGGVHIWLRTPPGVRVPERPGILEGVDVKGDGGYVVVPPSMLLIHPDSRPGKGGGKPAPIPYQWADDSCLCQAPLAPGWLIPWLESAPATGTPHGSGNGSGNGSGGDPLDLASLARTGVPRGQRNHTLYRLACSRYRVHGTSPGGVAAVLAELETVLAASDRAGFTGRELRVLAESARRFIEGQERYEDGLRRLASPWAGTR